MRAALRRFLPFVWGWLERLRFCGTGEAHAFGRDGNVALGGKLPITTFGGSIGEGRLLVLSAEPAKS